MDRSWIGLRVTVVPNADPRHCRDFFAVECGEEPLDAALCPAPSVRPFPPGADRPPLEILDRRPSSRIPEKRMLGAHAQLFFLRGYI